MVRKKNERVVYDCPKCLYQGTSTRDLIAHDLADHGKPENVLEHDKSFLIVAGIALVIIFIILNHFFL